jgi:hypothetical protein
MGKAPQLQSRSLQDDHRFRCLRFTSVKKPILDLKTALMGEESTPRTARKAWPYWLLLAIILGGVLAWSLLLAD